MKQLKLIAIALLFSNFSFAQKDIAGKVKTEVVKKKAFSMRYTFLKTARTKNR